MRFAYIDSQGKEVGIPSVEALQLRIELGAIGEETMFFDASTEKWGPAKEHEIFRTLSRETKEKDEGGFVAPPPPTMLRMAWPDTPDAPDADLPSDEAPAPEPAAEEPPAAEAPDEEEAATLEPAEPDPPTLEPDEEQAATLEPAEPDPPAPEEADPEGDEESFDFGDVDVLEEASPEEDESELAAAEGSEAEDPFSFGDFGTLDLEPAEEDPEPVVEEPAPVAEDTGPSEDTLEPAPPEESAFDFGDGLEMEAPTLEEEEYEASPGPGGGMELEQPLSEYSPDDPPSGMDAPEEDEGFSGGLELEDAAEAAYGDPPAGSGGGGAGGGGGEPPGRDVGDDERRRPERRPPRARPARAAKKKKSKVGTLLGIMVVGAALGVGGWFGWNYLQDRQASAVPEEPVVVIPEIASHLEPTLAEAAEPAYQATIDSLRAMSDELSDEPGDTWLSGDYLANPSRFEDVEAYWEDLGDHLDLMQEREEEIFMAGFEARLDSLGVEGEDRTALEERARAGFQAAGADRRVVYRQLDAVVQASLDLHDFLLSNEDAIDYSPSRGGLSRDPVTEAVPASPELGREMWQRVEAITRALDGLGALDRVTTDRIMGILLDKLADQPIR